MEKYKTAKDYSGFSDFQLLGLAAAVIANLNGNVNFPDPDPDVAELTILYNEFQDAVTAAKDGGTNLVTIKNEKRQALIDGLQKDAIYVDLKGKNIKSIMESSGYDVYSTARSVAPASGKPFVKSVVAGPIAGETIVKTDKVEHAVVYELRYTLDDYSAEANWIYMVVQTATTFYLPKLTLGKYIWIQMRTISTKGPSDWSDPYNFMIR